MAHKITEQIIPFSEMEEILVGDATIVERVFDSDYEAPYSYEREDEFFTSLQHRYEEWTRKEAS